MISEVLRELRVIRATRYNEDYIRKSGVTCPKTHRVERIHGFGQTLDFFFPDEMDPTVVIEAKLTRDDGTARDKWQGSRNWRPSGINMWQKAPE